LELIMALEEVSTTSKRLRIFIAMPGEAASKYG
jgi:hypothetical protein